MIKLIVGLGNPGQEYERTRHNAGFLFLDYLYPSAVWSIDNRFNGQIAIIESSGGHQIKLLKPMTFMNRSGQAVGNMMRYYQINLDEILIAHDELDFQVGVIKLKKGGGHAGHNGIRDVISNLKSNDFYRLRIGIDRPNHLKQQIANYVLTTPSKAEFQRMNEGFDGVIQFMDEIIIGGERIGFAMNKLNSKK